MVATPAGRAGRRRRGVTLKPFFSSTAVMYFEVSTSWKPSSPKLKMESFICCASLARASTPAIACFFRTGSGGGVGGGGEQQRGERASGIRNFVIAIVSWLGRGG